MSNDDQDSLSPRRKPHHYTPHALAVIGVIIAVYLAMRPVPPPEAPAKKPAPNLESSDDDAPAKKSESGDSAAPTSKTSDKPTNDLTIKNVTIHGRDGGVIWTGTVDLSPTVARIEAGERLEQFRNDAAVFQNRENRLPSKPRGYYHEFVHPTPGLDGPGPQRVVTGRDGEIYYTSDHYETFKRVR